MNNLYMAHDNVEAILFGTDEVEVIYLGTDKVYENGGGPIGAISMSPSTMSFWPDSEPKNLTITSNTSFSVLGQTYPSGTTVIPISFDEANSAKTITAMTTDSASTASCVVTSNNAAPFGTVICKYITNYDNEELTIGGAATNAFTEMVVDGVNETIANNYTFASAGTHYVRFIFGSNVTELPTNTLRNGQMITCWIGNNVTTMRGDVFTNCFNLETVYLPDTIESTGRAVFLDCFALKYIKGGKKYEGDFNYGDGIYTIDDFTYVRRNHWLDDYGSLWGMATAEQIGYLTYSGNIETSGVTIYIPEGIKNIREYSMVDLANVTVMEFPSTFVDVDGDPAIGFSDTPPSLLRFWGTTPPTTWRATHFGNNGIAYIPKGTLASYQNSPVYTDLANNKGWSFIEEDVEIDYWESSINGRLTFSGDSTEMNYSLSPNEELRCNLNTCVAGGNWAIGTWANTYVYTIKPDKCFYRQHFKNPNRPLVTGGFIYRQGESDVLAENRLASNQIILKCPYTINLKLFKQPVKYGRHLYENI